MAVFQMKIVILSIQICRHHRTVIGTVLPVVGFTELNSGNFGNSVRLIGRFQNTCQQGTFLHWLSCELRVNTRTAQKQQFFNPSTVCRINNIAFNHQVAINEICRVGVIGMNTTHFCSSQINFINVFRLKEVLNICLPSQIKFGMGTCNKFDIGPLLKFSCDSRTDHATMPCDIDFLGHVIFLLSP